jgi:hypothetical protein
MHGRISCGVIHPAGRFASLGEPSRSRPQASAKSGTEWIFSGESSLHQYRFCHSFRVFRLLDFQHQPNFRAEVPSGISIAVHVDRVAFTIESELQ